MTLKRFGIIYIYTILYCCHTAVYCIQIHNTLTFIIYLTFSIVAYSYNIIYLFIMKSSLWIPLLYGFYFLQSFVEYVFLCNNLYALLFVFKVRQIPLKCLQITKHSVDGIIWMCVHKEGEQNMPLNNST